jgi:chromodomain-helicase-DNA-binding protein 4
MALRPDLPEKPKPFQVTDAEWLSNRRAGVLGHKTGMGKTLMALMAHEVWNPKKTLVLGKKSSASVWQSQPKKWTDRRPPKIIDSASEWASALRAKEGWWFMTYDRLRMILEKVPGRFDWECLIADELHKLRNRDTKMYGCASRLNHDKFVGMSATWASRGPQDLWAVMHMMDRKQFPSYWSFVKTWCYVDDTGFGTEVFGVKNVENLRKMMTKYYRSRTWSDVGREFDPTTRYVVDLEMTPTQRRIHEELATDMMSYVGAIGENLVIVPSKLALVVRQRQLCVTPKLLDPSAEYGAGIEWIIDQAEDDPHTVIFTPFTKALPIIEQAFREKGHNNVFQIYGGMDYKVLDRTIAQWKKTKGVMLCSLLFAESFALDTTRTATFLGFDWDPNNNIQAEGRLRRMDSMLQEPVIATYIHNVGSIEDHCMEVVNDKVVTIRQVFNDYINAGSRR